ncbi:30S ribosome-binding factor RbfA [Carboxylicivirga sp. M1479]|uniref:30S ribosome-binding factor RbfA n=1 Tax=Carboxylicivirga sp. M1479 TaxID=2594476 RepID=UPI0011783D75|nr:30S ribosome-binding factor RbfA [Carboxylicivirga sp. M1479]TRX71179.1 30S ribosome-binding factor RbfA [Carboxylicivirga sp. M1479]
MDSTRQKKISRLLQKEISEIFQREMRAVSMGTMVSVTAVRISPDLGQAKTYLSIFPTGNIKEVMEQIDEQTAQIRFALGKRVGKQMRIIPELKFYVDDSLDYLDNIDRLLKK